MLRAFCFACVILGALATPFIPGETLLQLAEERADYPSEMEGDQAPAPSHIHVDMNAPPKQMAATVIDPSQEAPVSLLEVSEDHLDFQPALKQLSEMFSEATKPVSSEEMTLLQDVLKVGSEFLFKDVGMKKSAKEEVGQTLLQTEEPKTAEPLDMVGMFAKLIDYPITESEKTQLNSLISGFSALMASAEPQKGVDSTFKLNTLLDMPEEEEHPLHLMNELSSMFNNAMQEHFANEAAPGDAEDENEDVVMKQMKVMPESSGKDSVEDFDMDALDTKQPAAATPSQESFEDKFNMNVNVNKMMDVNRKTADVGMMNAPSMAMARPVQEEAPVVPKGPDAMQEAFTGGKHEETLDLLDEQQLIEDKEDSPLRVNNALQPGSPMGMPEPDHNNVLAFEMEKNVKITQIPDHTS